MQYAPGSVFYSGGLLSAYFKRIDRLYITPYDLLHGFQIPRDLYPLRGFLWFNFQYDHKLSLLTFL